MFFFYANTFKESTTGHRKFGDCWDCEEYIAIVRKIKTSRDKQVSRGRIIEHADATIEDVGMVVTLQK